MEDVTINVFPNINRIVKIVKAKFRIYNSSKSEIDGFAFALTLPDQQGGRS
jgi:hypothetical protein